jgi:hypothetical protein
MLGHLSSLEFFRPEVIPERIDYLSGYASLRKNGLGGLLDLIRDTLKGEAGGAVRHRRHGSAPPSVTNPASPSRSGYSAFCGTGARQRGSTFVQ